MRKTRRKCRTAASDLLELFVRFRPADLILPYPTSGLTVTRRKTLAFLNFCAFSGAEILILVYGLYGSQLIRVQRGVGTD